MERVLLNFGGILVQLVSLGGAAADYVAGHLTLLRKLAIWYPGIPELQVCCVLYMCVRRYI